MKKFYTTILIALIGFLSIKAQKTLITQNFGGAFAHNESMSTNSSGLLKLRILQYKFQHLNLHLP